MLIDWLIKDIVLCFSPCKSGSSWERWPWSPPICSWPRSACSTRKTTPDCFFWPPAPAVASWWRVWPPLLTRSSIITLHSPRRGAWESTFHLCAVFDLRPLLTSAMVFFGQSNPRCFFFFFRLENCLEILIKSGRLPEAALFAKTYVPSHVSRVLAVWKEKMSRTSVKAAQALADPAQYPNLFPNFEDSLKAEQFYQAERKELVPGSSHSQLPVGGTAVCHIQNIQKIFNFFQFFFIFFSFFFKFFESFFHFFQFFFHFFWKFHEPNHSIPPNKSKCLNSDSIFFKVFFSKKQKTYEGKDELNWAELKIGKNRFKNLASRTLWC